ncbi:uncharacterized protein LOC141911598 [Tubulanus polymorphus]|uniref:uncharacterized protein LOC141911598 n=1 Tax=Tubulanus polymorphus TaxID=672921 RepID=UPI003DA476FC
MSSLIGIFVDVSGSMRRSFTAGSRGQKMEGGSWARSIFKTVDEFIKHDVSSDDKVFSIGFGAKNTPEVFDLLNTVRLNRGHLGNRLYDDFDKVVILNKLLTILESNGAPYVRDWADCSILLNEVSHRDANTILSSVEKSDEFRRDFVRSLPDECRIRCYRSEMARHSSAVLSWFGQGTMLGGVFNAPERMVKSRTKQSIRDVVHNSRMLMKIRTQDVSAKSIMSVEEASAIMHDGSNADELKESEIDEMMETVESVIYGGTPFFQALRQAESLFKRSPNNDEKKVLVILSDGFPTDSRDVTSFRSRFLENGVTIVTCFITTDDIDDPRRLYSKKGLWWNEGARFLFDLSSTIATQVVPRTIFVKRGWNIDITDNETRLFFQISHPDFIADIWSFARDVVCSQDALVDLLAWVDLDLLINKANQGFRPQEQSGGTCYANAVAVVLYLAMKRIVGRTDGYPNFFDLRAKIIDIYGMHGANTRNVLDMICPEYRLHHKPVEIKGALVAISKKRPVVARFRLTDDEWRSFSLFFRQNPRGILSERDLKCHRPTTDKLFGHAVVLTSYNSECLRFMNSWGTDWADSGYFKVANARVIDFEFFDVYWTLSDLHPSEIREFEKYGPEIADRLFKSLRGLQSATYTCPICRKPSKVTEFTGKLVQAKCPNCLELFSVDESCHDLVLNMYLTSLG